MTLAARRGVGARWPLLAAPLLLGCTLGSETPPGCRADHPDDCAPGWVCRAGACFAYTTGATARDGGTDGADVIATDADVAGE